MDEKKLFAIENKIGNDLRKKQAAPIKSRVAYNILSQTSLFACTMGCIFGGSRIFMEGQEKVENDESQFACIDILFIQFE